MTLQRPRAVFCLFTFVLIFFSVSYGQETVYNNFGSGQGGWDYTHTTGWTISGYNVSQQYGVEQAMGFESNASGVATDIWVAVSYVPINSLADTVIIRLVENPFGLPPDSAYIMEEWTLTNFGSWNQWNTPLYLPGNGTSLLEEGHSYWLWAIGGQTTWTMWCLNEDPSLTCQHTIRREDEDWLNISNETAGAFRVDVTTGTGIPSLISCNTLSQNYPNPFRSCTNISYSLANPGFVNLNIYNSLGRKVHSLLDEFQVAGSYTIDFDASQLPAGFYFYKLESGNQVVDIKKMSVMK